jgi:predicted ATPase
MGVCCGSLACHRVCTAGGLIARRLITLCRALPCGIVCLLATFAQRAYGPAVLVVLRNVIADLRR